MDKNLKNRYAESISRIEENFPTVDVEDFLIHKGIECTRKGDWLRMKCLLPGHDDSNPSFFIHRIHGGYNCYVCGSGSWNELLKELGWIEDKDEIIVNVNSLALIKDFFKNMKEITSEQERSIKIPPKPVGMKKIDRMNILGCHRHLNYLKKRQLSRLTDFYDLYYTEEEYPYYKGKYKDIYKNRVIVPVEDRYGKVIWHEGRLIAEGKTKWKYWRQPGVLKENHLFNLHRVISKGYKWAIVVEGIFDAMLLWSWGLPGLCCFGSNISDEQLEVLIGFKKLYVCLDNDAAGIKGYNHVKGQLKDLGADFRRIVLPYKKDVNDVGQKLFIKHFYKAKKV